MRWMALLALAATASADGKFVSTQVPVVGIPDQQAILVFKDGRERLVIDTAYSGEGDLAWIVPLPAPPRIEPVSPAVFRTIEVVTMPDVEAAPSDGWQPALFLLAAVAAIALIPGGWLWVRVAAIAVLAFVLMVIPATTMAKGGAARAVTVLSRGEAGSYETATVESVDADALLAWLQENGFKVAPEVRSGIEAYVRGGWVFAVARLKAGGSGGRAHPLSFEFEAKEPVYPMRLTGAQDRPVALRLFVLSDRRARCDALETESCYRVDPKLGSRPYELPYGDERRIGQPELLGIAGDAYVLTTLGGRTLPGQADLRIGLEKFEPVAPVVHSRENALTNSLTLAAWVAFFLLLPCHLVARALQKRKAEKPWRQVPIGRRGQIGAWCCALGLALLAGGAQYLSFDVAAVRGGDHDVVDLWDLRGLHRQAEAVCEEATDPDAARATVRRIWLGRVNPYTGWPVAEEESPGNYGFEVKDGKIAYVHYDATGARVSREEW